MKIVFQSLTTAEEYCELVQRYAFLVDAEMKLAEETVETSYGSEWLPQCISAVNVIGYLRGQHNMFVEERPQLDFQGAIYHNEDSFERRLALLIAKILQSASAEVYKTKLQEYYVDYRTRTENYNEASA